MSRSNFTNRYSVGSMESLLSNDGPGIDSSFMSVSSSGSVCYEIESEVGREALKEICCSALSRILDFPDCQLETLLGYDEENRSEDSGGVNVAKNITASFQSVKRGLSSLYRNHHHHHHHNARYDIQGAREEEGVDGGGTSLSFGTAITDTDQVLLLQLMTHMSTYVSKEGLFRKSGNKARIDQLVKGLEGSQFSEVLLQDNYNANDFASVLKQFFSELPEPLLLKRHLDAYLQAAALSSSGLILQCLQLLMLLLPPVHRIVLQNLLDLLFEVTQYPENKMDSHNLSLIFAPTLFLATRYETLPPESLEKLSKLLAYMIKNCEEIFEVPSEVHVVAERYCKKKSRRNQLIKSGGGEVGGGIPDEEKESVPIDVYSTSCKRECVETFHEAGKERAVDEVAQLYELVKNMPEGPQKAHFMKRFESASKSGAAAGACTPCSVTKKKHFSSLSRLRRSKKKNKENATPITPRVTRDQIQLIKPCFKQGPLLSEFDSVEDENAPPLTATPCRNKENALQEPANFKTPNHFMAPGAPASTFKTPSNMCMVKDLPTRSSLVTDV